MDFKQGYNRSVWQNFLEDSFLPEDFRQKEGVINFKGNYSKKVTMLGECSSLQLNVFEVNHSSVNDARVGLSKEAFSLIRDYTRYNRALLFFVPQNSNETYRFSYVEYTPKSDEKGKLAREITNPRRYSFILGKNAKVKTPQQYLIERRTVKDVEDLKNRFSVEVLTKEFYDRLFEWYDKWAIEEVKFPDGFGKEVTLEKGEQNRIHLIRLLTRFIFIWFIKQKCLIPDWIFNKDEIKKILNSFDSESLSQGNYYNGIIQNLFFATLNKPINEREFAFEKANERKEDYGIKTKYRDNLKESMFSIGKNEFISLFDSVPFLNGGLFECLDNFDTKEYIDGFSREKERCAFVPNALFWGKENKLGLIELFDTYNFTVEENTPQDIDVALDPELLGKAFENLLGTFNEETKTSARNKSGSFYTPREIVEYMIDTSLKEYISYDLEESSRHKLDSLFSYSDDISNLTAQECHFFIEKIHNCKILDPACGSGAFPMGVLNKLTFILEKLDPNNEKWKEMQRQKAIKETEAAYKIGKKQERDDRLKEISDVFEMNSGNYGRKLYLLENCIHGVDIQPIAIQISKLRFFISLIVDQKTGGTKSNNYSVLPLPNLETKFVASNALIGVSKLKKGDQGLLIDCEIEEKQKGLLEIRHQYFSTRNAKDKIDLRNKDKEYTKELSDLLKKDGFYNSTDAAMLAKWNPYCQTKPSDFLDANWMFGIKDGFDIVIGNPPYIQLQNNHGELADIYCRADYECFTRSGDIYQLFYERGYDLLKKNGHLCFITSNKWMRAAYGEKTRNFFADKANPKILIDFAGQRVFESATVDVNILLVQKAKNQQGTHSCIIKDEYKDNMTDYIEQHGVTHGFLSSNSWVILNPLEKKIKEKIEQVGIPLKDWDISINYGIKTGCNDAFIIDKNKRDELVAKDKKSAEIIRPILRGRDIKRYGYEFAEQYIITTFPSRKIDIDDYPAVRDYLIQYGKKKLEQSGKPGARKKTPHKWFETQDTINYWDDFSKQKIIYPNMTKYLPFYYDTLSYFANQKCFIITGNNMAFLTAFLNSSLFKFCFRDNFPELLGGTRELSKIFFDKIPILQINNKINKLFETKIIKIQAQKVQGIETIDKEIEIDNMIFDLYQLSEKERKLIGFIEIQ